MRRGYPSGVGGLMDVVNNPMYAAAVGLILYGKRHGATGRFKSSERRFHGQGWPADETLVRGIYLINAECGVRNAEFPPPRPTP